MYPMTTFFNFQICHTRILHEPYGQRPEGDDEDPQENSSEEGHQATEETLIP